jgi:hypothetical protein
VIAYRAAIREGRLKAGTGRLGLQRMLYFDLYLSRRVNPWQPAFRRPESKLGMTLFCTIEYGSTVEERRCGRVAVAECADCGASVCSICCKECCGKAMCGYCYDYHVIHSCVRGSGPTELRPVPTAFRPAPHLHAV